MGLAEKEFIKTENIINEIYEINMDENNQEIRNNNRPFDINLN